MSLWGNNTATNKIKLEWDQTRGRWPLAQNDCSPSKITCEERDTQVLEVTQWWCIQTLGWQHTSSHPRWLPDAGERWRRASISKEYSSKIVLASQSEPPELCKNAFRSLELLSDGAWAAVVTENWQSERSRGLNCWEFIWDSIFSTPFLPTPSTHSRTAE